MAPPKKYCTPAEKWQAIRDKSKRYYVRIAGKPAPKIDSEESASSVVETKLVTRLKRLCNTNQYEVVSVFVFSNIFYFSVVIMNIFSPVTAPKPAPPPDPFPKFGADARAIMQEFEELLKGKMPHNYVEVVLRLYFKSNS
ncbi:hypothetical protein ARMGADRAFT_1029953 [Armillaria gallica]|uniref:Uncharacterized protein n=1 Tax=Armillaria gallica TaxID=47427 RepID=A0A2H3DJV8_ARMGA|nr:hypothetical protein ARMGADRAFT_1029953 [Armillaria gallica]